MGKYLVSIVLLMLSTASYAYEAVSLVEVFVNTPLRADTPLKNSTGQLIEVKVYDLSAPERFENELSQNLPETEQLIKTAVLQKVQALPHSYFEEHVVMPYEGILKATEYELTKLPAIVFNNGETVIYGIKDIGRAVRIREEAQ